MIIDVHQAEGTVHNKTQLIKMHYNFIGALSLPNTKAEETALVMNTRKCVDIAYVVNNSPKEELSA